MLKTPQGLFTQGKASLKLEIELATTSCFVVVRFGLRSSPGKARFLGEGRLAPVIFSVPLARRVILQMMKFL